MADAPTKTPEQEAEELLNEPEDLPEDPVDGDDDDDPKDPDGDEPKEDRKDAIIRQLNARLRKANEKLGKGKGPKPQPPQPISKTPSDKGDDIRPTVERLALAEEKRQFGYEHGLTPEETDAVFRVNPNPTKETLDDPFVKGGIAAIRARKRAATNTPPLGSRTPRFEIPKKENATDDEKQAAFEKGRDAFLGRNRPQA